MELAPVRARLGLGLARPEQGLARPEQGLALVQAPEAPRSNSSAPARARAWDRPALARAPELVPVRDKPVRAPEPDRPALAATEAQAEPWGRFGPRRRVARRGLRGGMLGTLAFFACVWLLEARRATC
jgi:hypothetical protein